MVIKDVKDVRTARAYLEEKPTYTRACAVTRLENSSNAWFRRLPCGFCALASIKPTDSRRPCSKCPALHPCSLLRAIAIEVGLDMRRDIVLFGLRKFRAKLSKGIQVTEAECREALREFFSKNKGGQYGNI